MAYPVVQPATTQLTQSVTNLTAGNTTTTCTIPDPPSSPQQFLTVINYIKYTGQSSTASPVFTLQITGITGSPVIARRTMTATVADVVFDLNFSSGLPLWSTPGVDFSAATSVTIVVVGTATVSNQCLTVGYTYVPINSLRP